ncbi:MAG: DUF294 nucleotidyltransferase-like domain-containing protein [Ignavibacteriae bacterium]|nr:DUF294 nucleotidyltransferase-like domain-containing protein [Ignavibacteriota bacterium]
MNGKREMIKELTNSAWSILSKYESDERSGLITREEAQKTAVSRIQYLRYGDENKDYFWITDMHPNMIMHPYRLDLNGKDLTNFSDPHGKKLFVEFVTTVKESEHGYVDYMWQWKDDSLHIVPKLSYVRIFKPWGWVIGTGIYIEDVKKEITALTKKLVWISVGISILIAFLLLFNSRQSLKIERQRIQARNELHDSKEKYRTLVEAATEGLIMLIGGKISFLNNIISKISGYEYSELINLSLSELISGNNNKDIINTFSKEIVKEGQYEINLRKKAGGFIEVLVTSSTASVNGQAVNIITVKDLSVDKDINLSVLDYQKLLGTLDAGFFRASIDSKGKFIFANDTAIKILGYDNFRELSEAHFPDVLASTDDKNNLRINLREAGFIKNKVLKIRRKDGGTAIVSMTLAAVNGDSRGSLICDGILEDITLQENARAETDELIAGLKSSSMLIEQSIKDFLSPVNTVDSDSTINSAIDVLSKKKTDSLLITKNDGNYIGIVTNSDIQKRVLSLNLSTDNPVYLIMSSPVVYINEDTSVCEGMNICEEKNLNHLAVRNDTGGVTGILRINDVYSVLKESLSFFIFDVRKAETNDELKQLYKKIQLFIKPLIKSDISVKHITNITSSFSDAVTKRIIELTIKEIGKPPAGFSFISMGSEGRREETLLTDQDNAVIYENVPNDKESPVKDYFGRLGERVCNSLDYIGYSFCKGSIMAKNRQWCQPVSVWEKYFADWINTPEPQNLLDATIFFDFRNIYGNEEITDGLRETISKLIKGHPLFLYHLAHNTYNTKPPHISSGNILPDKHTDTVDLKNAVNLIVMFARTYALQNNIRSSNTIDRLNALKSGDIINANTADEIIFTYNFLMKLRFKNQAGLSNENLPLSNTLNTKKLIEIELTILKKVLSLIPVYQNKISADFRLTV